MLLRLGLLLLVAWATQPVQAQTHWSLGLKAGSMLDIGGIAVERESGGNALAVNVGLADGRQTMLLLGRRYSSPQGGNRTYLDARVGALRVETGAGAQWVSLFAFGAGYEAPLVGVGRFAIETGVGLQNIEPSFTPLTRAGIFLGASLGVRF